MVEVHIDFEWRSEIDIKRGPEMYFGAKRNGPLCASYAFTNGEIRRWLPAQPCPPEIVEHAATGGMFVAHNAANFERHAVNKVLAVRFGWPGIPIAQWRDTMAAALAMGLPADLDNLTTVLNVAHKKDKAGKKLIQFFCVPQPNGEFNDPHDPANHDRFEQFRGYCDQDVRGEMDVDSRLIPLSAGEQANWCLDQRINDRGIRVDRSSAIASLGLIARAKQQLDLRIREATGGAVGACSEAAKLTRWVETQGVHVEGVAKDDVLEALDLEDLPARVREALEIRQAAAKTSTAKIAKLLRFSEGSGRIKNRMRFHGTGPGRWSCLDPNLFNLPRPRKVYADAAEEGQLDVNQAFEFIRQGEPDLLERMYGPELGRPLDFLSDSLRGFLWAAPGHDLIAVDYSSIQGVLCAWFADETWKLQAIQEILDDPKKPDLYRRAAAGILNTTTDVVTKKHWGRQLGKVSELALGFAGGVPALVSMAKNYSLRRRELHNIFPGVWAAATEENREYAVKRHEQVSRSRQRQHTDTLTHEAWIACALIVRGWRQTNSKIKESWTVLETAARNAVRSPGQIVTTLRGVQYRVANGALWCRLPSGRCICYASPRLKDQVWARLKLADNSFGEAEVVDRDEAQSLARKGKAKIEGETSPKVTVLGWSNTIRKMERYALYGGLCMENLCLGAESCILRVGMAECEANGYPIVFHCYDEAVAEMPRGAGSIEEMCGLMLRLADWAKDLPLGAAGWRGKRYRK
jgi:DNA polymerase